MHLIFDKAFRSMRNEGVFQTMTLENPADWTVGSITNGTSRASAMKLSAVNACVECLTNSISKLPIFIMDSTTKEHIKHPLLDVLEGRPNEAMTPSVYKKLTEANRLLRGNAYSLIIRDRASARPRELLPLPPDYVTPFIDDNGRLWYVFVNHKSGEVRKLRDIDVLHYKAYSEDGIHGISVLKRAEEVLSTAKAAQKYENKFYTQNARVPGVLTVDADLDKGKKDKIREEWRNLQEGADNAFRIAVLDLGMKYQAIGVNNSDAQFIESRAVSVADISRFFNVPLYKLNAGDQNYNANEQNGIEYVVGTLHPTVTQYEQEDTYKLLFTSERANYWRIRRNMMAELRGDFKTRAYWYKVMREIGVFSPNDICALEDMQSVLGGDSRYANLNNVPLELFEELSKNRNQPNNTKGGK